MTEIEPISDADLAAICAALDGLPVTSERPYRGMIARIRRAEDDNAQLRINNAALRNMVVSSGDTAQHWTDEAATYLQRAMKAEAQIAALQAERATMIADAITWKPIETAPHGVNVLLYCPDRGITNPARVELGPATSGTSNAVSSSMSSHAWATHWMPLPSLPTEETDNG